MMKDDPTSEPNTVSDPHAAPDPAHTASGAPTDQAHRDVGDGTLLGAVPAGLTPEQMQEMANTDPLSEGGTS
jgi:hypothetical protein